MIHHPRMLLAAVTVCAAIFSPFNGVVNAEPAAQGASLPALKLEANGRIGEWLFQPGTEIDQAPKAGDWEVVKVPFLWTSPGNRLVKPAGRPAAAWAKAKGLSDYDNGWFERTVAIPSSWAGQRVWLNFDQVDCDAMLWIDDRKPVYIEGPEARVDVTDSITPGKDAKVRVWVTRWWKGIPKTAETDPLRKAVLYSKEAKTKGENLRTKLPAGLSSYVYFEARSTAGEVTSVFARPSYRDKMLYVDVEGRSAADLRGAKLKVEITDPKGQGGTVPQTAVVPVEWNAGGKQTVRIPWEKPHFWELGDGYLYQLKVSLVNANGAVVHSVDPVRFGFRELWVDGREIVMNGHPIHFRQAPVIDAQWPSILFWKSAGFNALEWHPNSGSWFTVKGRRSLIIDKNDNPNMRSIEPNVLDAADEEGIALLMPAPNASSISSALMEPDAAKAYARETRLWISRIKNHPSIVMWLPTMNTGSFTRENPERIGTNPTKAERVAEWYDVLFKLIKTEDPTRLVTSHCGHVGEVDLPNQYLNFMPLQERIEFPSQWARQGDRPWGAIEHGAPFMANFLKWNNVPLFTEFHAIYFGDRAYARETDAYVDQIGRSVARKPKTVWGVLKEQEAEHIGEMTMHDDWETLFGRETNRYWRAWGVGAGWKNFNFELGMGISPQKQVTNEGQNFYRELTPEQAKAAMEKTPDWANAVYRVNRETMQPLLTFIGGPAERFTAKDHEFYAGEKFEKTVVAVWDGIKDCQLTAAWELTVAGKAVQSGTSSLQIKPGEIVKQPFTLEVPATSARTEGELKLKVTEVASGSVVEDKMALTFWPKETGKMETKSRWAIFDPAGRSKAWLESLGVSAAPIGDREALHKSGAKALVVGREALGKSLPFTADDIRGGLRVLMLEQGTGALETLGLRIQDAVSRYTFPRDRQNAALKGLNDEDFINWRGESDLLPKTSVGMKRWPLARPPHWGNYGTVASVVLETPHYGAFTPVLEAEFDLAYSPLLEWRHGSGGVIFSTLDFTGRVGIDPAATRLARNLVASIDKPFSTAQNRSVAYCGNDAGWEYIKTLGFAGKRVEAQGVAGLNAETNVLVIGSGNWTGIGSQGLKRFVAKGGKVLVLPQKGADLVDAKAPLQLTTEPVKRARVALQTAPVLRGVGPQPLHWRSYQQQDRFTAAPAKGELLLDGLLLNLPEGKGSYLFSQLDWQPLNDGSANFEKVRWNVAKFYRQLLTNLGVQTDETLARRLITPEFSAPFVEVPLWKISKQITKSNIGGGKGLFPALATPIAAEAEAAKVAPGSEKKDKVINAVIGEGELNQTGLDLGTGAWVTFAPRRSDSLVHIDWITSPEVGKLGYARSYIYSSRERVATFAVGVDYWIQFRVNGQPCIDHSAQVRPSRSPFVGEFRFTAPLKVGWNLMEAKVASGGTRFGFSCMVSDPGDAKFEASILPPRATPAPVQEALLPEPKADAAALFYTRPLRVEDDPYRFNPW